MLGDNNGNRTLTPIADPAIVAPRLYMSILTMTDGRCVSMQEFQAKIIGPTGDCAVLQITGDLDAYTAPALRQRMLDLTSFGVVQPSTDMRQDSALDSPAP